MEGTPTSAAPAPAPVEPASVAQNADLSDGVDSGISQEIRDIELEAHERRAEILSSVPSVISSAYNRALARYTDIIQEAKNGRATLAQVQQALAELRRIREEDAGDDLSAARLSTLHSPPTARMTVNDVVQEIKRFLRVDALGRKIVVVQNIEDLPDDVLTKMPASRGLTAQGITKGNKIYLVASNISNGQAARAVLLHEIGVHLGLERLLGADFAKLVAQIKTWADRKDGSVESELAQKAVARVNFSGDDANAELAAYFVEEAVLAGIDPTFLNSTSGPLGSWLRSVVAAFKAALRRFGFNTDRLNAVDVVNMAYGAAQLEVRGAWHGTAAVFRVFNHAFMNTGEGAQAFGWGTYLAQRFGVAKDYFYTLTAKRTKQQAAALAVPEEDLIKNDVFELLVTTNVRNIIDRYRKTGALTGEFADFVETALEKNNLNAVIREAAEIVHGFALRAAEAHGGNHAQAKKSFRGMIREVSFWKNNLNELEKELSDDFDGGHIRWGTITTLAKHAVASMSPHVLSNRAISGDGESASIPSGQMMSVALLLEDSETLNHDRPIAAQPEKVRDALMAAHKKIMEEGGYGSALDDDEDAPQFLQALFNRPPNMKSRKKARNLVNAVMQETSQGESALFNTVATMDVFFSMEFTKAFPTQKSLADFLLARGVKGIKFFDGESRAKASAFEVYETLDGEFLLLGDMNEEGYVGPFATLEEAYNERDRLLPQARGAAFNYVVFDTRSIQPVVYRRGVARGRATDSIKLQDTPRFSTAAPRAKIEAFTQSTKDVLRYDALTKAERAVQSSSFLRDLAGRFGSRLPSVKKYVDEVFKMGAAAVRYQDEATKVQDAINGLSRKEREGLMDFIARVTESEVAINTDKPLNELGDMDSDAVKLNTEFRNTLTADQRRVYLQTRDALKRLWTKRGELLRRAADDIYNPLLDQARKSNKPDLEKQILREREQYLSDINARLSSIKGDYFPMMRFGQWVVVKKSPKYVEAQKTADALFDQLQAAQQEGEQFAPGSQKTLRTLNQRLAKQGLEPLGAMPQELADRIKTLTTQYREATVALESLKQNADDYTMMQFEARSDAERVAREIGGTAMLGHEHHQQINAVSRSMLKRMEESLEVALRTDANTAASVVAARKALQQVFLTSLPERSALLRQARRRNVAGFDRDMQRAIASSMLADSFYLSRMEYNDQLTEMLTEIRRQARDANDVKLQQLAEELVRRQVVSMDYNETPIQDMAASISYVYFLGISPAYLMANLMQPFMVSLPQMFARHGAKSTAQLFKGMTDAAKIAAKSLRSNVRRGEIDFNSSDLKRDEKDMLNTMLQQQLLTVTLVHDLSVAADGGKVVRAAQILSLPAHHVEVVNRIGTALAAYRMQKDRTGGDVAAATEYAKKILADTHFDYTVENAPYWMRPGVVPMSKLLFQFKKYQAGMISLYVKNIAAAVGDDPQAKREARKALLGMMVTHGAMAGAIGLPAAGTMMFIANVLQEAFGEDEEWDAQTALRNYLRDVTGSKEAADVLAKGLPTLLGADLSRRIGLGDVLNPFPTVQEGKEGRELYQEFLMSAMGPFLGGLLPRMSDGFNYMANGDLVKGTEAFLPKFVSDVIRSGRFATEGVTNRQGVVMAEELRAGDLFLQATGFPPSQLTDLYEARAAIQRRTRSVNDASSQAVATWSEAMQDGDARTMAEAWSHIQREVNPMRQRNGLKPITYADLVRRHRQRMESAEEIGQFGLDVQGNRQITQVARFAQ